MFAAFEAFRAYFVNAETDFVCIDRVERIERGILPIVVDFAINIEASKARLWEKDDLHFLLSELYRFSKCRRKLRVFFSRRHTETLKR